MKITAQECEQEHDILLLSRLQLFRNVLLENPALIHLLKNCRYRQLTADEVLLSTEQENTHLYILIKGQLVIQLGAHEDIPLATVEPGECVGEMSIIDSRVPSARVSASADTTVLVIDQETLWRMVSVSHEIARNLLYIMAERVRYSNLVVADSLEMQRKYQEFATTDALTGLHNRGWLDDVFDREIKRSERDELPLSLLMIDVDDFKKYNDDYGHLAGDRVLVCIADAIRKTLRPNDLLARFGGEEFAVLLPETSLDNARIIAERLRRNVSLASPGVLNIGQVVDNQVVNNPTVDGQAVDSKADKQLPKVTISLGITTAQPQNSLERMIAAADNALYDAKRNGKNRFTVASELPLDTSANQLAVNGSVSSSAASSAGHTPGKR